MKRTNHVYDVRISTEATPFTIVAKSRGDAVAQVRSAANHRAFLRFREAVRKESRPEVIDAKRKEIYGAVSRCFKPDSEGGWKGVQIECRGERTATLPAGIEIKFSPSSGNSKWHRRMEAMGIEAQPFERRRRNKSAPDGKFARRFVRSRESVVVPGVNMKLRKRPSVRRVILAAVAKAVQTRLDANSQESRAKRNHEAAIQRDKKIRARAEKRAAQVAA